MTTRKPTITTRLCETKPAKRIKIYDTQCPGFFVSITPIGNATFYFKYWDRTLGKQVPVRIGNYDPEHLTIEQARAMAYDLRGRVGRGEDVAQSARKAKAQKTKLGRTVADAIDEYVEWISEPEKKEDGEMRPRLESWENFEGHLNRFVRPTLGKRLVNEIDNDDIAKLIDDVLHGRVNRRYKASLASAHSVRDCISSMFTWVSVAGRRYVEQNPCRDLPKLPPMPSRDRVLTENEIRTLWWGLDRPELPWPRSIALALKFELVTMLRTKELLTASPNEVKGLGTPEARIEIPLRRVKKRRPIIQPLSSLAQEILAEAITSPDQPFIFHKGDGSPFDRRALANAVRGYRRAKPENWKLGICEFLGMEHWTPHDLRRTPATLAFDIGFSEIDVGHCLDHQKSKGAEEPARVTRVYVREGRFRKSRRLEKKREILEAVADAIRDIVGTNPAALKKAA